MVKPSNERHTHEFSFHKALERNVILGFQHQSYLSKNWKKSTMDHGHRWRLQRGQLDSLSMMMLQGQVHGKKKIKSKHTWLFFWKLMGGDFSSDKLYQGRYSMRRWEVHEKKKAREKKYGLTSFFWGGVNLSWVFNPILSQYEWSVHEHMYPIQVSLYLYIYVYPQSCSSTFHTHYTLVKLNLN